MNYGLAGQTHLKESDGFNHRYLLWIETKNRTTGAIEPRGIWNGETDATFEIEGEQHSFFGFGRALQVDDISYGAGLVVTAQRVVLSGVRPVAVDIIKQTILSGAKTSVYQALFDPVSNELIDIARKLLGEVDKAPTDQAAGGEGKKMTMELVSDLRNMTDPLPLYKSHTAQQRRSNDGFRRYGAITPEIKTKWGLS